MPDDLRTQMERIREMVDAFDIPRLELEGYEADDILGSIARQAVTQGLGVKIITGDRDLLQLVDERIIVNLAGSKLSEAQRFHRQRRGRTTWACARTRWWITRPWWATPPITSPA